LSKSSESVGINVWTEYPRQPFAGNLQKPTRVLNNEATKVTVYLSN